MTTKSMLAVELSRLKAFESPKAMKEQYMTDSETAAEVLWFAFMKGDIKGKTIADLGCGTGILGKGALILGAKKVFFLDNDEKAMEICRQNVGKTKKAEFLLENVSEFGSKADTVIQNPPFGSRQKHADLPFLEKAFETADIVYSFHKLETREFVEAFAEKKGFSISAMFEFDMPLKATQKFHRGRIKRTGVGCWRFEKAL